MGLLLFIGKKQHFLFSSKINFLDELNTVELLKWSPPEQNPVHLYRQHLFRCVDDTNWIGCPSYNALSRTARDAKSPHLLPPYNVSKDIPSMYTPYWVEPNLTAADIAPTW